MSDWEVAEGTSYTNLDVAFNWTSDDRDSALMPTSGSVSRLSAEATVPGSTLGFIKQAQNIVATGPCTVI